MTAAFAGVLDGRQLWVAVDDRPGRLTLRERGSGTVLTLPSAGAGEQPGHTSARLDLAGLTGEADTEYDVVLVDDAGGAAPLWIPPQASIPPSPPSADQRTHLVVVRAGDGTVRVRRRVLTPAGTLVALATAADTVVLTIRPLDAASTTLALLADDDRALATVPLTPHPTEPTLLVATLSADLAPDAAPQVTRVATGAGTGPWTAVRRHDSDLAEPGKGAALPTLHDDATGRPRLRLRWSNETLLQARLLAVETAGERA